MPTQKDDLQSIPQNQRAQTDIGEETCGRCEHYLPALPCPDLLGNCDLETDANKINWNQEGYVAGVYVGSNLGCAYWTKKM